MKTFKFLDKCIVKLEVNQKILGSLLAFSIANKQVIDLVATLTYPLSPIPLSVATGDGYRRKHQKLS